MSKYKVGDIVVPTELLSKFKIFTTPKIMKILEYDKFKDMYRCGQFYVYHEYELRLATKLERALL